MIESLDLNDLRTFDSVAALSSFSAAARVLELPKSNVSRSVARLETTLGTRLFQRTTRTVVLTPAGEALKERCTAILAGIGETVDYISGLSDTPRGRLRVSAGIGFGINALTELLPTFLERYPEIQVSLGLSTRQVDLVAESIDCAIRFGPLPDSTLVATRLGSIDRHLCAAQGYVARHGAPAMPEDLSAHAAVGMPGPEGRPHPWTFVRGEVTANIEPRCRVLVDEALALFRLVRNGAGIGIVSGYLARPEVAAGRLVKLLPEWRFPPLPVHLVYPSRRELAPSVRAFADFVKEACLRGDLLQDPFDR